MDACESRNQFVSLYLFENGRPCEPEKLRVKRNEIDKFFTKSGKIYHYHGKALYTLSGEMVKGFEKAGDRSAYVLIAPQGNFEACDYKRAFDAMAKKNEQRKTRDKSQCRSDPGEKRKPRAQDRNHSQSEAEDMPIRVKSKICAIFDDEEGKVKKPKKSTLAPRRDTPRYPCSQVGKENNGARSAAKDCRRPATKNETSCGEEDVEEGKPKAFRRFLSQDKYPCCVEDSDAERPTSRQLDSNSGCDLPKKSKKPPPRPQKKGFMSKCCPCCVKRPKSRPTYEGDSRPCSNDDGAANMKATQTTPADLAQAKRCFNSSVAKEKQRKKMYGRKMQQQQQGEKAMTVVDYRKAREKYMQRRKKMETQISKSLEKEKKKEKC